ncbi:MAG: DUF4139 domain-containing protein, partial [Opitutae bacterium]|nr:DUF4139 domain-containing protein [Opitutae bacterium]
MSALEKHDEKARKQRAKTGWTYWIASRPLALGGEAKVCHWWEREQDKGGRWVRKHKRKQFSDEVELNAWLKTETIRRARETTLIRRTERGGGNVVTLAGMTPDERAAVAAAITAIRGAGGKPEHIAEAATIFAKNQLTGAKMTVRELYDEHLEALQKQGKRWPTIRDRRLYLAPFVDAYGNTLAATVDRVRVTLFEGGHSILSNVGLRWLEKQCRGQEPVWEIGPLRVFRKAMAGAPMMAMRSDAANEEILAEAPPEPVQVRHSTYAAWDMGKKSVPAGDTRILEIERDAWPVAFTHLIRPSLDSKAFVQAKAEFAEPKELPPGTAFLFIDGAMVDQRQFSLSGREATVFFGTDPLLTCTTVLKDKKTGEKGIFKQKQTFLRQWTMTVRNAAERPAQVRIEEPRPLPRD